MTIEFSEFNASEELPAQRKLYADCFPEEHVASGKTEEHYLWKFKNLQATPPAYEFIAREGDHLLGYYAALPFKYFIDGREMTCGMVCDVMTHSQARGKGIFTKLGKYSLERLQTQKIDFVSGYPIRPEVLPGHLKVGWKVAFELPLYIKPLRINALLSKAKLGFLAPLLNLPIRGTQFLLSKINSFSSEELLCSSLEASSFFEGSNYDIFFETWKKNKTNYLVKTSAFYKWRLSAPNTQYKVAQVIKNGQIVAFAVLRKVEFKKLPLMVVLDLMVLENTEGALSALHREIQREALDQNVDSIAVMMSRHSAGKLNLLKSGFFRSPGIYKLILNPLNGELDQPQFFDERNWDLMWVDSDDN